MAFTQLYVTADAANEALCARCWKHVAHMCYRVSPDAHLLRCAAPKGGLLVLTDAGAPPLRSDTPLTEELLAECAARSFSGVAVDFERPPTDGSRAFLRALEGRLRGAGRSLFVPEAYADAAPGSTVLLCTALSGGVWERRLDRAVREFGARRLALDVQWLRMEFPLPCPSGQGRSLSPGELAQLRGGKDVMPFFSPELSAEYFLLRRGAEHRFILYDTEETLLRKLRMGRRAGCRAAFLLAAEAPDALPGLLERMEKEKVL